MINKDIAILEGLTKKYGKDFILNELNASTYFDAGRRAIKKKQFNRGNEFYSAATDKFRTDNETNEFTITDEGFECWLPKGINNGFKLYYDLDADAMYRLNKNREEEVLEDGSEELRTYDRKIIRMIINYFNEFYRKSKYNDKNLYIL